MAEPTGFDVLKKSFDFELPVTGHKGRLRFATRMDRIIVTEQSPKVAGSDSDDRYELNYLGRIIVELEGKPVPLPTISSGTTRKRIFNFSGLTI